MAKTGADYIAQFRGAILEAGLTPPEEIIPDGKIHRFSTNGKASNRDGYYRLFPDDPPSGAFGCWRQDIKGKWTSARGGRPTAEQRERMERSIRKAKDKREREREKSHQKAAQIAQARWDSASQKTHPYLERKGVEPHGARVEQDGTLLIPMFDAARKLWSLQTISADGTKLYLPGGKRSGTYYAIGKRREGQPLCIVEGFATGASVHEATGYPVAVAFDCGSLLEVAQALRAKYQDVELILCADDDHKTKGNPGITKATETAQAVGGKLAVPVWSGERDEGATDFNDLHQAEGLEAVRAAVQRAQDASQLWGEIESLTASIEPQPYPLEALPEVVRGAVMEVQGFVQCPAPIAANSALSALSLAIQGHFDVQRDKGLIGPVSIAALTLAESGERKSQADKMFSEPIREFEAEQAQATRAAVGEYKSKHDAWDARRDGLKSQLRSLSSGKGKPKPDSDPEGELLDLDRAEPQPPKVPRLIYADATPEALAHGLSLWPSAGVMSAEAGIVFGSHGMGKDSVMRNLTLLNSLWSGEPLKFDRRTVESMHLEGVRLTVGLQVQESTLREFLDRTSGLARGSGFLARFLVAWPRSTQGTRKYKAPPENWPALTRFHRRLRELLERPVRLTEQGGVSPSVLEIRGRAKDLWVEFYDAVEVELSPGRELSDVRDVASKIAENAARLAALFSVFETKNGVVEITPEHMKAAISVAAWHLTEAQRFFGELAYPQEIQDALRLVEWLVSRCRSEGVGSISRREIQRLAPTVRLRRKDSLDAALGELERAGQVRRIQASNNKRLVELHPELLRGGA